MLSDVCHITSKVRCGVERQTSLSDVTVTDLCCRDNLTVFVSHLLFKSNVLVLFAAPRRCTSSRVVSVPICNVVTVSVNRFHEELILMWMSSKWLWSMWFLAATSLTVWVIKTCYVIVSFAASSPDEDAAPLAYSSLNKASSVCNCAYTCPSVYSRQLGPHLVFHVGHRLTLPLCQPVNLIVTNYKLHLNSKDFIGWNITIFFFFFNKIQSCYCLTYSLPFQPG